MLVILRTCQPAYAIPLLSCLSTHAGLKRSRVPKGLRRDHFLYQPFYHLEHAKFYRHILDIFGRCDFIDAENTIMGLKYMKSSLSSTSLNLNPR